MRRVTQTVRILQIKYKKIKKNAVLSLTIHFIYCIITAVRLKGSAELKKNMFIGELAAAAATVDKIRVRPIV